MGGSDDADNLVALTAEEHYVAHQLLVKIHPGNMSIAYAAIMMSMNTNGNRPNNKLYGWLRKRYSESRTGRPVSKETGRKISKAKKGVKLSRAHRKALSEAHAGKASPKRGKTHAEIYGAESKRIRDELSAALRGKKQPQVVCPHCNKTGGKPIMHRYHFDKCKAAI